MKLAGFADEAAASIEGQIAATQALGWKAVELRSVDGKSIDSLSRERVRAIGDALKSAGIEVCALGSTIANWGESIETLFAETERKAERALEYMEILGTRLVRIMSYAVLADGQGRALDDQMEEERFRRLRWIARRTAEAGFVPVHENCHTYGGMSPEHTLRLLEAVPELALVYDTGNPPLTPDFRRSYPYPMQDPWEFYQAVRDHIVHMHIKDARFPDGSGREIYTWPGEGDGEVLRIVTDLLKRGYRGAFSIEPHMAVVFHDASVQAEASRRFDTYVEYGRLCERLLDEAAAAAGLPPSAAAGPESGNLAERLQG